jgi:hypothetical protein
MMGGLTKNILSADPKREDITRSLRAELEISSP